MTNYIPFTALTASTETGAVITGAGATSTDGDLDSGRNKGAGGCKAAANETSSSSLRVPRRSLPDVRLPDGPDAVRE